MHIGAGTYEGKEIKELPQAGGFSPRALTIKEEIFTIIGVRVAEATVLDINDGNGMYGIEALSRGATVCLFVNPEKTEAALTADNLRTIGVDPEGLIIHDEIASFMKEPTIGEYLNENFDVIFFEAKKKEDLETLADVLQRQKPSGVSVAIYPNKSEFTMPADLGSYKIMETREFDDKKVAVILKVNL